MGDAILFVALFYGGETLALGAVPIIRRYYLAHWKAERIIPEHPAVPAPKGIVGIHQESAKRKASKPPSLLSQS
jgi:hypothetical protein